MTGTNAAAVKALYSEQETLLKAVLTLAREQLSLCAQADFPACGQSEYTRLLSERRRLLNRMAALSAEFQLLKSDPAPSAAESLPGIKPGPAGLAAQIIAVDQDNRRLLQEKMAETRQALLKLCQSKNARQAYTPGPAQASGFFLDHRQP